MKGSSYIVHADVILAGVHCCITDTFHFHWNLIGFNILISIHFSGKERELNHGHNDKLWKNKTSALGMDNISNLWNCTYTSTISDTCTD